VFGHTTKAVARRRICRLNAPQIDTRHLSEVPAEYDLTKTDNRVGQCVCR
jgi:hypothetical protein